MENLRIIEVSFYEFTNRIKIKEITKDINKTKIINLDHYFNSIKDQAIEYLTNLGINIVATASTDDKYILLSDSWGHDNAFININD